MHNPAGYGTRPIEFATVQDILPTSAPMGYMGASSYGMAELQMRDTTMRSIQQTSSRVHIVTAGIVTAAILLLLAMGMVFPGMTQF